MICWPDADEVFREIRHPGCPFGRRRWPMEDRFLIFAGIVAVVAIVLSVFLGWMDRKDLPRKQCIRRGMGNAMLGLQEVVEPSVNYVLQSQNVEQKKEEDDKGLGGDEEAIRSDLAEALSRTPVDPEEVRRHLSAAVRLGMDWKALFNQVASEEVRERPFRAPSIPPTKCVAPRE
jgi:hypothetical protein